MAVQTVISVAKATRCRTVIAHVSQPELLEQIRAAREEGYEIYAESCPHYFNLTVEDLERLGPWAKFTPPMNTAEKQAQLWKLFDLGLVTTIGSDHCPYPKEQKEPGEKNIWDAPNGIPGVETSLRLMLDGAAKGKTTINRVVECMCENPAKEMCIRDSMEIACAVLEMHHLEVTQAWDGRQALELFENSEPGHFDAVLMDMQMPVMDGCAAARAIRALHRPDAATVPIIAVTANAFSEDIARTQQAGMNAHISKPIDFNVLEQVLGRLLAAPSNRQESEP